MASAADSIKVTYPRRGVIEVMNLKTTHTLKVLDKPLLCDVTLKGGREYDKVLFAWFGIEPDVYVTNVKDHGRAYILFIQCPGATRHYVWLDEIETIIYLYPTDIQDEYREIYHEELRAGKIF